MKVSIVGGGAMAPVVHALKYLIKRASEQTLDCPLEVMADIADMQIVAIANAVDDGPSTKVLRDKYGVPGYYADVADTLGAFCPDPLLAELFKVRIQDEIGGQLLRNLFLKAWGQLRGRYGTKRVGEAVCCFGEASIGNRTVENLLRKAFFYRLEADGFRGHSLRNLIHFVFEQVALQEGGRSRSRLDAQRMALEALNFLYKVPPRHRVVTATWASAVLEAETKRGEVITGQAKINLRGTQKVYLHEIKKLYLVPSVEASREAVEAILHSDKLIISCGDLISTLMPILLAAGIKDAIREASPEVIYVAPQITRRGETLYDAPYTVQDLVDWIGKAIGTYPHRIIYDRTEIPSGVLRRYPGEKKIRLGGAGSRGGLSRYERQILMKGELGMEDADGRWVHNPEALALQGFLPIFYEVRVGVLA